MIFGGRVVRSSVINNEFGIGNTDGFTQIKASEINNWKQSTKPIYYCDTTAWMPFVLHVRFGWESDSLTGRGGESIYVWFGGSFKIMTLDEWSQ